MDTVAAMAVSEFRAWLAYYAIKGESPYRDHAQWHEKTKPK